MSSQQFGRMVSFLIFWGGRTIRVWAIRNRGSQVVKLGAELISGMTGENYQALIGGIRKAALSCPWTLDHTHEDSGDGVRLTVGIPDDCVEVKMTFVYDHPSFAVLWGKALKRLGYDPRDCRIEDVGPNNMRFGKMVQAEIDGR